MVAQAARGSGALGPMAVYLWAYGTKRAGRRDSARNVLYILARVEESMEWALILAARPQWRNFQPVEIRALKWLRAELDE